MFCSVMKISRKLWCSSLLLIWVSIHALLHLFDYFWCGGSMVYFTPFSMMSSELRDIPFFCLFLKRSVSHLGTSRLLIFLATIKSCSGGFNVPRQENLALIECPSKSNIFVAVIAAFWCLEKFERNRRKCALIQASLWRPFLCGRSHLRFRSFGEIWLASSSMWLVAL